MDKRYLPKPNNTINAVVYMDETQDHILIIPCESKNLDSLNDAWKEERDCRFVNIGWAVTSYRREYKLPLPLELD